MNNPLERAAFITGLAERSPGLGRTALMKFCYFLQTIRGVPLGYRFSLYSYGPFDSSVLADLETAENLGWVQTSVVTFNNGYGYKIEPGTRAKAIKDRVSGFVGAFRGLGLGNRSLRILECG